MLCQLCGEKDVSIHLTKIINGNIEEKHLCDDCAKHSKDLDFDLPFSFHKLFTGLIGSMEPDHEETKDISCHRCGLTYDKFLESGKFGCSDCFETFGEDIDSLLRGIHGHGQHIGKTPVGSKTKTLQEEKIQSLKDELEKSIAEEEFEKAALLRDEIKKIKEKLDNPEE